MKKRENSNINFFPSRQEQLFLYDKYFSLFAKMYNKNLLPNKILLTGQSGIGKSTFAYHLINFILSDKENYPYDINNLRIYSQNKSFRLVNQNIHPNFYLIDNIDDKQIVDITQVRNMIIYVNKTSYKKNMKFILVNNAEYLNMQTVNALLKIIEEPTSNTYFILIHNSSLNLIKTLKSRCVEFNIFFTNFEKKKILDNLLSQYNLSLGGDILDRITSYYDSPGMLLNIARLLKDYDIKINKINLIDIIDFLMQLNLKDKNNLNLNLLQCFIELFYFNEIKINSNKKKILLNYSKAIKQLNYFKKYNIDMNNVFYELKENIIYV